MVRSTILRCKGLQCVAAAGNSSNMPRAYIWSGIRGAGVWNSVAAVCCAMCCAVCCAVCVAQCAALCTALCCTCCSVLQCVAVCYGVLQCVAVCGTVLQWLAISPTRSAHAYS